MPEMIRVDEKLLYRFKERAAQEKTPMKRLLESLIVSYLGEKKVKKEEINKEHTQVA